MRMTFKRGFICGMITLSAFFGVYLTFFNHPPAANTLEANAHHSSENLGPPKFSDDFGPPAPKSNPDDSSRNILAQHGIVVKNTNEKILRDQGTHPKDEGASKAPGLHGNDSQKTESNTEKLADDNRASAQDKRQKKPPQKPDPGNLVNTTVPATKIDDSDDDIDDDVRDSVKEGAPKDMKDGGKAAEIKPGDSGGSRVISHRDYPKFPWDKWVTDNDLVSVGTIWGYCDDPEPPEIGKILLMKDEDRGGLKVVVVMNTTFDEPVESGTIVANVLYGGMNFYDKSMDICTLFDEDELEPGETRDTFFDCPMAAGSKFYTKDLHIPFFVPSGHYTAKAKLVDQQERSVICTSASLKL